MISKIKVSNIASYDETGIEINSLDKFNFIYGNNGCGKSTLSKVLESPSNFPSSEVISGDSVHKTLVYNKNFINQHFNASHEIPGIFTLGKEAVTIKDEIKKREDQIKHLEAKLPTQEEKLKDEQVMLNNLNRSFIDRTWELKKKFDDDFSDVLTGARKSKTVFNQTLISKIETIDESNIEDLQTLKEKSHTLFKQRLESKPTLITPNLEFIRELRGDLFQEKIIGKQDLDISNMIRELNLDDWVLEGTNHLHTTNNKCPFCQQELPVFITSQLEEYFDKTYFSKLEELKKIKTDFTSYWGNLIDFLMGLKLSYEEIIDQVSLSAIIDLTQKQLQDFEHLIEKKINEPSLVLSPPNYDGYLLELNMFIESLVNKITAHNTTIENICVEKKRLTNQVWNFLALEIKTDYDAHLEQIKKLKRSIEGKTKSVNKSKDSIENIKNEIKKLKASVLGVDESVNSINRQLKSFGFTNFHLATTPEKGVYKILRSNGEIADETLSEGEKTFITFLYYYNLVFGNYSADEESKPKILVIDDPISSLDSKVLFIVSTLIQSLVSETNKNTNHIMQIFVLTHNTYFFKEVTNRIKNNCTFHILTKRDNKTFINSYEKNPIKNSYQLLWEELNMSLENSVSVCQNIMRRILENYFSFTGNISLSSLETHFEGDELLVYKSLIAWLHDGSHSTLEDLFVAVDSEGKQIYFNVFRNVFMKSGHEAHFTMMVNTTFSNENKHVFAEATESLLVLN